MKKVLALIVVVMTLFSALATAEVDLSGMSYEELVALKDQINLAIWNSEEWQEVTVPQGVWKVGEDIPAGTWTVKCEDIGRKCYFSWGEELSKDGTDILGGGYVQIANPNNILYKDGDITEYSITVENGYYIFVDPTADKAVFTPYAGKPSLGFK